MYIHTYTNARTHAKHTNIHTHTYIGTYVYTSEGVHTRKTYKMLCRLLILCLFLSYGPCCRGSFVYTAGYVHTTPKITHTHTHTVRKYIPHTDIHMYARIYVMGQAYIYNTHNTIYIHKLRILVLFNTYPKYLQIWTLLRLLILLRVYWDISLHNFLTQIIYCTTS